MTRNSEALTSVEENTHRQRRWGCTCGCLTFLVGLTLAALAFFYYALKPYPLVSADRWLNARTIGFGVLRLSSADAGMADVFSFVASRLEQRLSQELTENERRALRSAMAVARQSTDWIIYPPIYFTIERSPDTEKLACSGIAQFRHFFGYLLCRSTLQSLGLRPNSESPTKLTYVVGTKKETSSVSLVLAHRLLLATNAPQLIDELVAAPSVPRSGSPSEKFLTYYGELHAEKPEPGEDFGFVLVNENGAVAKATEGVLEALGQQQAWDRIRETLARHNVAFEDIQGARLSIDLVSADRMKCVASFSFDRSDALKRFSEAAKLLEGLSVPSQGQPQGPSVKIESRPGKNSQTIVVELTGLRSLLGTLVEKPSAQGSAPATRDSSTTRP